MIKASMTDADFAKAVNHGRSSKLVGVMVTLYDHPKDFPKNYVARVHFVGNGRHWPSPELFIVRDTLAEVRAAIPAGMRWMNRSPVDDPCIVEIYL